MVIDGVERSPFEVRSRFRLAKSLETLPVRSRGWTVDVLAAVQSLGAKRFSLEQAYSATDRLSVLHPNNSHVRQKIRQQLQVLRDLGFVEFLGRGQYHLLR